MAFIKSKSCHKEQNTELEIGISSRRKNKNQLSMLAFGEGTRRHSCHYKLQAASQKQPFLKTQTFKMDLHIAREGARK